MSVSRWLYQRERVDKHGAATGGAGRDGVVGAGGIQEGILGFELVQGQVSEACKGVTEQQETGWAR